MEETSKTTSQIEKIKTWLGTGSINIFGLPFSGKDTHGRELATMFNGSLIGGGDILRNQPGIDAVKNQIATGALAPTEEFLQIVLPYLGQQKYQNSPLILSSIGRWHGEEPSVMQAAQKAGHELKAVILLTIDQPEAIRRYNIAIELNTRGERHDDMDHVLEKRFSEFNEKTGPVIQFYRDNGLLIEIDGMPERALVTNEILNQLELRVNA